MLKKIIPSINKTLLNIKSWKTAYCWIWKFRKKKKKIGSQNRAKYTKKNFKLYKPWLQISLRKVQFLFDVIGIMSSSESMSIVYQEYAITMITVQYSLKKKKKNAVGSCCLWLGRAEWTYRFQSEITTVPFLNAEWHNQRNPFLQ